MKSRAKNPGEPLALGTGGRPGGAGAFAWRPRSVLAPILIWLGAIVSAGAVGVSPVEFSFKVASDGGNPFARELWAEVILPSGRSLKLPAFFDGDDIYAVRARADMKGVYRLGKITEEKNGSVVPLRASRVGPGKRKVGAEQVARSAVGIAADDPRAFALIGSGERFVPVGMNLAWSDSRGLEFYRDAFPRLSGAGLNWARIWMAHWDGMNLDWLPKGAGPSPLDGTLSLQAARNWDRLLGWAEENGVYVQLVLQHHGQYSSEVNPNWAENPWNEANGGFLKSAREFFSSPRALTLTRQKYRYIVARWGYSPAVMAWELFNEIHWVDGLRGPDADPAAVEKWISAMADYLRSVDRYSHLVTLSTEDLRSPLYSKMDYYQPHLYSPNLLAGVRHFAVDPAELDKPVFYGEVGDDHLEVGEDVKKSGVAILPPVWAGVMGPSGIPPQIWTGWEVLSGGRLDELAAVAKLAREAASHHGLASFSAVVETGAKVPFSLPGAVLWQRRPPPEIQVPLDGREPAAFGAVPRIYMNQVEGKASGFGSRAVFHLESATAFVLRLTVTTSPKGGAIRASVDGAMACEENWPEPKPEEPGVALHREFSVSVPAGRHTLLVENPASWGWFDLLRMDSALEVPVLAAVGRRDDRFVMAWLWNRPGVYSISESAPASGVLVLEDVPAGTWTVSWRTGNPAPADQPQRVNHPGGTLRLPTPPIARHAVLVMERKAP